MSYLNYPTCFLLMLAKILRMQKGTFISKHHKSGILLFIILATITGCTKDLFSESELNRINVYSEGNTFSMLSNFGDTLIFTIKKRTVSKKKAELTVYEKLNYELEIYSTNGKMYSGKFFMSSLGQNNVIEYQFETSSRFHGAFDVSTNKSNVIVDGVTFVNSACDENACFSENAGFLKFNNQDETLSILLQ